MIRALSIVLGVSAALALATVLGAIVALLDRRAPRQNTWPHEEVQA